MDQKRSIAQFEFNPKYKHTTPQIEGSGRTKNIENIPEPNDKYWSNLYK